MRNRRSYAAIIVALGLICRPAPAQNDEIEALARAYFDVLQTEGLTAVGQFMHPDALVRPN